MGEQKEGDFESFTLHFDKLSAANPEDVKGAIQLLDSIWQTAGRDLESQFPELYPDSETFDDREYNQNYWVVKNEKTREIIGIVGFSEFKGDVPEHAWLGWFAVKEELRGGGLGVEMLEYVTEHLKKLGKTDLYAQTSDRPNMKGNEKFYNRNDFPVVATVDTNAAITIGPDAGALSEEVFRTVVEVSDKESSAKGITNFIRRRRLVAEES